MLIWYIDILKPLMCMRAWGACGLHLELGRQWKVIVFHMYFVNRRVRIFKTTNLYGNDT
jgi:hypothetical protein